MEFLISNRIELAGFVLSIIYLYLSVKQNPWCWLFGMACSALYVVVFFNSKFYADMTLQFYYIFVSIYGWYNWIFGKKTSQKNLPVSNINLKLAGILSFVFLIIWGTYIFVLKSYTDSDIAVADAFTTALSIVATWMLARKLIEHWLLWILIDAFSMGLYIYKGLYLTAVLFLIYTIMAVVGYVEWKSDQQKKKVTER